jgi:hypothetical protein
MVHEIVIRSGIMKFYGVQWRTQDKIGGGAHLKNFFCVVPIVNFFRVNFVHPHMSVGISVTIRIYAKFAKNK